MKMKDSCNYPFERSDLDVEYIHVVMGMPIKEKLSDLTRYLTIFPSLQPLCKEPEKAFQQSREESSGSGKIKGSVPDLVITLCRAVEKNTGLGTADNHDMSIWQDDTKVLMDAIREDKDFMRGVFSEFDEPEIFAFIYNAMLEICLLPDEFRETIRTLFSWGIEMGSIRWEAHSRQYPPDDDEPKEEHYDFGRQKTLRLFYLHVKLRGCRVSVDLTVPEDTTFEQLHAVLNSTFKRNDDHLYRFECDDGCVAVRDEEELQDGGAVLSDKCYLGHHLEIGSTVYYLFDYGDEWEHDITVKKVVNAEPKNCHIEIQKITGKIPEQYPDWDVEE